MLELRSVSKSYRRVENRIDALRDACLTIESGSFTALCGPSGSGKSTLLNIAGLTEAPTAGEVALNGHLIDFGDEQRLTILRRSMIGYVFQYFNLLSHLSATENVALSLMLNGATFSAAQSAAREMLERVGLSSRLEHRPEALSGGEMQRVAVARALVHRPRVVLADEPTGNLDSTAGQSIIALLRDAASNGAAVLMVTHNERAALACDRIVHILDGRIAA